MKITEFLEARIAEDEALAHAVVVDATARRLGTWEENALEVGGELPGPQMTAKFSPARVLAECAAKRAIIGAHTPEQVGLTDYCLLCGDDPMQPWPYDEVVYPCPTVRAIAKVYADHPDYSPGWA